MVNIVDKLRQVLATLSEIDYVSAVLLLLELLTKQHCFLDLLCQLAHVRNLPRNDSRSISSSTKTLYLNCHQKCNQTFAEWREASEAICVGNGPTAVISGRIGGSRRWQRIPTNSSRSRLAHSTGTTLSVQHASTSTRSGESSPQIRRWPRRSPL